jgi:hypothetical protein
VLGEVGLVVMSRWSIGGAARRSWPSAGRVVVDAADGAAPDAGASRR